ncbi:MAG: Cof-type HAD-IIB family hydrolase [Bacteroidota bacterium]
MEKQKILYPKMILVDLDGTLLNSKKEIGDKDWNTLIKLGSEGIIRVFATGRTLYSAMKVLDSSTPFDYLVFSSGAGIVDWHTNKVIYSETLNISQISETENILRKLEVNFAIQLPIPENHKYYFHKSKKSNTDFEWRNDLYKKYSFKLNSSYPLQQATQFLVILEDEKEFEVVKSKIPNLKVIRATSPIDGKSIWLEIFPENISKASGGKYLCDMLNISEQDTIGIGNDYNDIDLLKWTHKSFAVANSPEIIKKMFSICIDNENNPLSDVLEQLKRDDVHS